MQFSTISSYLSLPWVSSEACILSRASPGEEPQSGA